MAEDQEATCWGCGLRLLLPSGGPVYKCGWCGAITNQSAQKQEDKSLKWRWLRDRGFVCVLLVFILFVICKRLLFLLLYIPINICRNRSILCMVTFWNRTILVIVSFVQFLYFFVPLLYNSFACN